jgi:hypothetical protein
MTDRGGGGGCYMNGTRIRAARGEALVDTLTAGDMMVVLRDGNETLSRISI